MKEKRIVELPLNITEDRLVGSIDLKAAMLQGKKELEPGLMREAHGNILYVDEVNLLSDYLVNALLETAASGIHAVEREGVSSSHPSRFLLVGSMNPEEGKLRPQFLDRFGLYVETDGEKDVETRMEIMRRRLDYERNPAAFLARYEEAAKILRRKIEKAVELLPKVTVTANAMQLAARLAADAFAAGHRAQLAIVQTARAIAAMDGRMALKAEDIRRAAKYALPHRSRNAQMPPSPPEALDGPKPQEPDFPYPEESAPEEEPPYTGGEDRPPEGQDIPGGPEEEKDADREDFPPSAQDKENGGRQESHQGKEDIQEPGEAFLIPVWQDEERKRMENSGSGRRCRARSGNHQGRYVGYRAAGQAKVTDLALDATIRAAAPFQPGRDKGGRAIAIEGDDLRVKIREKRTGGCILFVVDASASMGANRRMREVKAAVLSMLSVSYQKRDRVALIAFRKEEASLLLGFTRSVELAQKKLEALSTGGRTPLDKGLELADEVMMGLKRKEPEALITMVLVSDGRASGKKKGENPFQDALYAAEKIGRRGINTIILDTENDFLRFHLCEKLNEKLKGRLLSMGELRSEGILQAVKRLKR